MLNGKTYKFDSSKAKAVVSVGNTDQQRQIINVAPGSISATSTDAINGAQIFPLYTELNDLNGRHGALKTQVDDLGKGFQVSAQGANARKVLPGETVDISSADANLGVSKGAADNGVKLALARNLALDSVTAGGTTLNKDGVTIPGGAAGPVTLGPKGLNNGGNVLTGVGAGKVAADSSDAVTGAQLATLQNQLNNLPKSNGDGSAKSVLAAVGPGATVDDKGELVLPQIKLDSLGNDENNKPLPQPTTLLGAIDALDGELAKVDEATGILLDDSLMWADGKGAYSAKHGDKPTNRITDVAPGAVKADSTDAVNGGQLHATNEALAKGLGGGAQVGPDGKLTDPTYAIHNPGSATATTPHKDVGAALGALDAGVVGNTGAIDKLGKDVANGAVGPIQQGATPGQLALVAPGATGAAPGAPQGLTNVAPGKVAAGSTDAVNGGQLNDVAQTANKGFQLSAQGADASQVKPGDTVDISGADANIGVTKGAADSKVKLALSRNLNVDSVTIPGGPNGPVTLGAKGLDNGGNVLTGVGAGRVAPGSSDAVTGDQLAATDAKAVEAQDAATAADGKAVAADEKAATAQQAAEEARTLGANSVQYTDPAKTSIVLDGTRSNDGGKTAGTLLSNVAQGSLAPNSTDAVNGTQLRATNQALADNLGGGAKLNPDGSVAAPTYNIHNPGSTTATTPHKDVGAALGALDKGVTGNTAAIAGLANGTAGPIQQNGTPGQLALVGPNGAAGPQGLTNVAPGAVAADSTDAVNGGQLHAVEQAANKGWQLSAQGANETQVKPGDVVDISGDANIGVTKGDADSKVKLALARNLNVDSLAAGGTALTKDGVTIANGPNGPVTLGAKGLDNGGNVLTGLGKGRVAAGSTDAVTGDQLAEIDAKLGQAGVASTATDAKLATAQDAADAADDKAQKAQEAADKADEKAVKAQEATTDLANKAVQYGDEGKTSIVLGGPASTDGGQTGGTRLSNVAQGSLAPNSTDAVNGTQLRATNQALADGLGGGAKLNPDGTVARPTYAIHNPGSTTATTPHNDVGSALGALDAGVVGNTAAIDKLGKDLANGTAGPIQQGGNALTGIGAGNVAAGSTDAVNGGQLAATDAKVATAQEAATTADGKAVKAQEAADAADDKAEKAQGTADQALALGNNSVQYDGDDKKSMTLRGEESIDGGKTGGTRLGNVAQGSLADLSTDAVNGSQLRATNQVLANGLGGGAAVQADGSITRPTYVIHNPGSMPGSAAATSAYDNVGDALGALDRGVTGNTAAIADLGKSAVHYDKNADGSPNTGAMTLAGGVDAAGNPTGTAIRNVAPGSVAAGSMEAVNGGQLHDIAQTAGKGWTLSAQGANASQVKPGETVDISGADANIQVAKGADDRNVKVALSRNLAVDSVTAGNTTVNGDGVTIAGGPNGPVKLTNKGLDNGGNVLTGIGAGNVAAGSTDAVNGDQLAATDARAVRAQASADAADAKAAAARAMAHAADMKAAAAQAAADAADMKAVAAQYAADAAAMKVVTAQLAADAAGLKAEQANGTAERALALGNNSVQYDDAGKTGLTLGGPKSEDGGRTGGTRLANVAQGLLSPTSTDAVNGAQLHATNERVAAHGTQLALLETGQAGAFRMNNRSGLPAPDARGEDAVAGGFGAVASGARSTAIGSNAVASGAGSVALGHGATDGGRDNVVSVGREGAERQVTNVAAGTRPTDAVNLGQLSNAIDHGLVAATGYTDHHVNALRFDLANVRRDADAGTASAMAVAGLPQAFSDSGGMIGGAIGVYQNETAFALGVSKVFGDGRTVVKGGATYVETSRGSTFGGNVGIGYQF
ncbi:YadA-like family protein [Sphingopyxis sp. C-1]|uniref:YadA-like family protein n=1 Tax=Sphingopyxis sp. C-1 TaxID=262667 RepID=UPI0009F9223F|nr:YadA-like family protein [Sphingopyxis sp. C-1]